MIYYITDDVMDFYDQFVIFEDRSTGQRLWHWQVLVSM